MHRFFLSFGAIQGDQVTIAGPQAHQIDRVLRMRPGERLTVLDNSGWEIETELTSVDAQQVRGTVVCRRLSTAEPRTKISLYQSVLKSRGFEVVLQKGTELGIVEFVPLIAERCVVSDLDSLDKKRTRWEAIIQEAAEQSRRGRKPSLHASTLFSQACDQARHTGGLSIILWEEQGPAPLRSLLRSAPPGREQHWPPLTINLFVGPEGGFAPEEVAQARRYGLLPATLGPRILRAETAGLVAAAAVLFELGDLG